MKIKKILVAVLIIFLTIILMQNASLAKWSFDVGKLYYKNIDGIDYYYYYDQSNYYTNKDFLIAVLNGENVIAVKLANDGDGYFKYPSDLTDAEKKELEDKKVSEMLSVGGSGGIVVSKWPESDQTDTYNNYISKLDSRGVYLKKDNSNPGSGNGSGNTGGGSGNTGGGSGNTGGGSENTGGGSGNTGGGSENTGGSGGASSGTGKTTTFTVNPDKYKASTSISSDSKVVDLTNRILGIINVFGVIILVIAVVVIGIKYMVGSVEQRADYKHTMVPILIGAVMLFSITTIINVTYKTVNSLSITKSDTQTEYNRGKSDGASYIISGPSEDEIDEEIEKAKNNRDNASDALKKAYWDGYLYGLEHT